MKTKAALLELATFATLMVPLLGCVPFLPPMHQAVWDGSVDDRYGSRAATRSAGNAALRQLLADGADVNARNKFGDTPLHFAAQRKHVEAVRLLLAAGANVNARGLQEVTPLHGAVGAETVSLLLAAGADVNARSEFGATPLHKAAGAETASLLLAAGADVNARSRWGFTPLHSVGGDVELARLLVARGADLQARLVDYNGWRDTPVEYASRYGYDRVAQVMLAGAAKRRQLAAQQRSARTQRQVRETARTLGPSAARPSTARAVETVPPSSSHAALAVQEANAEAERTAQAAREAEWDAERAQARAARAAKDAEAAQVSRAAGSVLGARTDSVWGAAAGVLSREADAMAARAADEARAEAARAEARATAARAEEARAARALERARTESAQALEAQVTGTRTYTTSSRSSTSTASSGTPTAATCPSPAGKKISDEATRYVQCINRAQQRSGDGWSMSLTTEVVQASAKVGVQAVRRIIDLEPNQACRDALRPDLEGLEATLASARIASYQLGNVMYNIKNATGCTAPSWVR